MAVSKKEVIRLLEKIALYMELKGENSFKTSAFRKAAQSLEIDNRSLSEIDDIRSLPGIGKATGDIIEEYLKTGKSPELEALKTEVPSGLIPLLEVEGLGGKKLARLYQELGVTDQTSLLEAAGSGQIEALKGFGKKSVEKMVEGVKALGTRPDRYPFPKVFPVAEEIETFLETIPEIKRFHRAGSMRRMRETLKDLDYVLETTEPDQVKQALLSHSKITEVIGAGETKVSVQLSIGITISVDFRLVTPESYATTLHHFTGSKEHNIKMRQLAKKREQKISEYGVEEENGDVHHFQTETEFFRFFDLPFIPPEVRVDGTEVERITEETRFLSLEDIRGDLHMHTTWSDGAYSIEEMIQANIQKGYDYMVITDHGKFLRVANGLNEERLQKQQAEIRRIAEKYPEIDVYSGVEMDILTDGTLDFSDETLEQLDFVIASIHSGFNQSEQEIMARLKTAAENPHVRLIAHPTGRVIGRREPYAVNVSELIRLASETGTALELNANPERLDLKAEHLEMATKAGVKIAINTDAHDTRHLDFMALGVRAGIKGWLTKTDVLNTLSKEAFRQFIEKRNRGMSNGKKA
ncbi:DNA polymerase/3'-5' exonuclease PolX [Listeria kieliensis]